MIERFNRTIKEIFLSISLLVIQRKFVDVLELLVDQYNNAIYASINMIPKEASRKENKNKVCRNVYPELSGEALAPKCSIGDYVRITKKKKTFDKGYTQRWTEEVITISKIQWTISVTYKVTEYNGDEIQVSFYEQELQKTNQYIFRIEKIIKKQGNKSHVKWLGYNDSFNSLVDNQDI